VHLFVFREDQRLNPITDVVKNKIIQVVEERHLSKLKSPLVYISKNFRVLYLIRKDIG
jgi:hypothetical protein